MRDGWVETTLGEVASWSSGKNISKDSRVLDGEFAIVGANGEIGRTNKFLYNQPLVVVGRVGSCGETYLIHEKVWISDNALIALPNTKIDITYLYYLLKSFDYNKIISGTTQPLITQGKLKIQSVLLPPFPEQKRIVDLISSVDSYIEALQQQLESAKRSRNAVLYELLTVGGDEWVETSLGEIADWGSGGTPKADNAEYYGGAIPWCVIGDLTEGEVWETEKTISQLGLTNSSAKIIDPGSVLLAMYGASIGRTGISAIPMATNQAIAFAKCKEEIVLPKYLLVYLQTQKSKFIEMGQGAAQPNISQTIIKSWPISLPPIGHQKKVIERIESFSKLIENSDLLVNETKKLRTSLLSDLLSGSHEIASSYDKVIGAA